MKDINSPSFSEEMQELIFVEEGLAVKLADVIKRHLLEAMSSPHHCVREWAKIVQKGKFEEAASLPNTLLIPGAHRL